MKSFYDSMLQYIITVKTSGVLFFFDFQTKDTFFPDPFHN